MKNAIKVAAFSVVFIAVCVGAVFVYLNYKYPDFTFVDGTKSGTIEITGYTGDAVNIVIPKKIQGKTVAYIGNQVFLGTDIESLEIPDTVVSIGEEAFSNCEKLKTVKLGNSVEIIGDKAFLSCKELNEINIPASVKTIGNGAFSCCYALRGFNLGEGAQFTFDDGILYNKDKTVALWVDTAKNLSNYTYPATLKEFSAFFFNEHKEIKSLVIPESMMVVPNGLCAYCTSLESVTLHSKLKKISNSAFLGCTALKSMEIPSSVSAIEDFAFPIIPGKDSDFKMIVKNGSFAHDYAQKNKIAFEIAE